MRQNDPTANVPICSESVCVCVCARAHPLAPAALTHLQGLGRVLASILTNRRAHRPLRRVTLSGVPRYLHAACTWGPVHVAPPRAPSPAVPGLSLDSTEAQVRRKGERRPWAGPATPSRSLPREPCPSSRALFAFWK
uniref:Uncharacterized protein n=1 Tax=Rousettus aegyptiacus TaxID=9407 RepID=A0A7J8DHH9_ROUAE|nr:hypothetical protein HJG63_008499 [Rousettus aegyptiacus]